MSIAKNVLVPLEGSLSFIASNNAAKDILVNTGGDQDLISKISSSFGEFYLAANIPITIYCLIFFLFAVTLITVGKFVKSEKFVVFKRIGVYMIVMEFGVLILYVSFPILIILLKVA